MVLPDPKQLQSPEHWLDLMEEHGVTIWNTAPPVMSMLLMLLQHNQEARTRFLKLKLGLVLLSGDFIPLWVTD